MRALSDSRERGLACVHFARKAGGGAGVDRARPGHGWLACVLGVAGRGVRIFGVVLRGP